MRLTIAPYLQQWDHTTRSLHVNVLVVPDGDPRVALGPSLPSFADARLVVAPRLFAGADMPTVSSAPASTMHDISLSAPADSHRAIAAIDAAFTPDPRPATVRAWAHGPIQKHLPESYRSAFNFVALRPSSFATIDDSFDEALRCGTAVQSHVPTSTTTVRSWSEALAYVMRQPALLRALGMTYSVALTVPESFTRGWLAFDLAGTSDPSPSAPGLELQRFLVQLPDLPGDRSRPLFSAVLFPFGPEVGAIPAPELDEARDESARLGDGFAQIVHAAQPTTAEKHQGKPGTRPPHSELGIRLGWDDEDVIAGINRAIRADSVPRAGAAGYRVDVRAQGDSTWHSLCLVESDDLQVGPGYSLGAFRGELRVEVHPQRVAVGQYWVLPYYMRWSGGSAVVRSGVDRYLRCVTDVPDGGNALYRPVPSGVDLHYGTTYEFRVRMADATGGGPSVGDGPVTPGPAPIASVAFKRFVPIGAARVDASRSDRLSISRPLLDYPAILCATAPTAIPAALDALATLRAANNPVALPDPDARDLEIRVMVRLPTFDPTAETSGYTVLYTTHRSFPEDANAALDLEIITFDTAHASTAPDVAAATTATSGPIAIPTARDVRLELRAVRRDAEPDYFGTGAAAVGKVSWHDLPADANPARVEDDLFVTELGPASALRAVFSRNPPAPKTSDKMVIPAQSHATEAVVERLAAALRLRCNGATLLGPPAQRFVFGCAGSAHRLAPDNSSLTFLTLSELVGSWTCAVRVDLDRDWSWKGLTGRGLHVQRKITPNRDGAVPVESDLGWVQMLHSVGQTAIEADAAGNGPNRDGASLVFIDVFPPGLGGAPPCELTVEYTVTAELEPLATDGAARSCTAPKLTVQLPVVTPPTKAPKIASVGHALSAFTTDDTYSWTGARKRMLWVELDRDLEPTETLFARVLAHAPDPLLLAGDEATADPLSYPDLPVDPELARTVIPGEGNDHAGVGAMQALIPATHSRRHFLVPLPPGTHDNSPELLGFYTYELRLGHRDDALWSTARGRYGPPLILEGVQHPAPSLACSARWTNATPPERATYDLVAEASFAQPFYKGENIQPSPPCTDMWMVLYAQVPQADGSGLRNVQVDSRRGVQVGAGQGVRARVHWHHAQILDALRALGLPSSAPLSVLAVELLPEPMTRYPDPLGADLGQVRLLRCSALAKVADRPC